MPKLLDFLMWRKLKGGSGPVYEIPQGWVFLEDKKAYDTGYNPFSDGAKELTLMGSFAVYVKSTTEYRGQIIGGPGLKVYANSSKVRFNNNYAQTDQQWTTEDGACAPDHWNGYATVVTARIKPTDNLMIVSAGFPGHEIQSHNFLFNIPRPGNITLYGTWGVMGVRRFVIYERALSDAEIQAFYDSQVEYV